ncbi:MAG: hypothetical protein KKG59_00185 [Nanoarchaeota archaeon]|nr:hypothetical protein [Nanoarchaeota archaeon]
MKIVYVLLGILSIVVSGCTTQATGNLVVENPGNQDAFAQCLTEKDFVMYGTEWCSHCQNQKSLFGDSFQYIEFVDCDENKEECQKAGVTGYPTWIVAGNQKYPGEMPLSRLAEISGCELA